jgi:hypothetical protein
MNKFALASLLVLLVACDPVNTPTEVLPSPAPADTKVIVEVPRSSETTYHCSYKYDKKYDIEFTESQRTEYHPPAFPDLLVYHIIDIRGTKWSVNQYEWADYTCIPTLK